MAEASSTNTALLVQVLDQLGGIRQDIGDMKSQLAHGARRFEAIDDKMDDFGQRLVGAEKSITPLTDSMAIMGPKVKTMETFLGKKLGPIVAVSSTVVAVALWLIALTAGAAVAWVKANLSDHLHWSEWHVSVVAFVCAFLPGYRGERQSPPPSAPSHGAPWAPPMVRYLHDGADGDLQA